jgi:VIT1/CCC1 family predicted Fe2+/Mn2+ transporter
MRANSWQDQDDSHRFENRIRRAKRRSVVPTAQDIKRYRKNWQDEIDSSARYRAMADGEARSGVARVYQDLAAMEDKHAAFWEKRLADAGAPPGPGQVGWRTRVLVWLAHHFGAGMVLPTVAAAEHRDRNDYRGQAETDGTRMAAQERSHARVLGALVSGTSGVEGGFLARLEGRHRNVGGNALRAAVLGANDGLCTNLSLVMGVAGAAPNGHVVLLAGFAGLVAGAFSMALGEWVSVTSARELAEREVATEQDELEATPEDEREELQLIYEAKGLSKTEADQLSRELVARPQTALEVLTREELGIDPGELGGSPWTAAGTSFVLFATGAVIPVLPFMFMNGWPALGLAAGISSVALFGIGAAITILTGLSIWRTGIRQLLLGLSAAVVTFAIGRLVGVAIG